MRVAAVRLEGSELHHFARLPAEHDPRLAEARAHADRAVGQQFHLADAPEPARQVLQVGGEGEDVFNGGGNADGSGDEGHGQSSWASSWAARIKSRIGPAGNPITDRTLTCRIP